LAAVSFDGLLDRVEVIPGDDDRIFKGTAVEAGALSNLDRVVAIAAIAASVPVLAKRTRSALGMILCRISASSTSTSVAAAKWAPV